MNITRKTKGRIVFGGSLEMSTIEAIKSTRQNIDLLYPDRMTYTVHYKGKFHYTLLEIIDGQLKTVNGVLLNLSDTNIVYVIYDADEDFIEPLTKYRGCFGLGFELTNNGNVYLTWRDGELFEVSDSE